MVFCTNCGLDLPADANFCGQCGTPRDETRAREAAEDAEADRLDYLRDAREAVAKAGQYALTPAILWPFAALGTETVRNFGVAAYKKLVREDQLDILNECPIARQMLDRRGVYEADPQAFGQLYNVRVRPAVAAMLLAGGLTLHADCVEQVLSRVTRHVFDGDQLIGGWASEHIASLIGKDTADAVNRYMDTVPGASVAGGTLHRIRHGHELASLLPIYQEHGSEGVIQGVYHMFGRDLFTPDGIPTLPVGTNEVHTFLTSHLGFAPENAADLVSLNFVELLADVMSVVAIIRLVLVVRRFRENSRLSAHVTHARDLAEQGDYRGAIGAMDEALTLKENDGRLLLAQAMFQHRAGDRLDAFLNFERAARRLTEEPQIILGGAPLSLRGIAAGMALATSDVLARSDEHREQWLRKITELTESGVAGFESVGNALRDRRLTRRFDRAPSLPPRSLSAALNFYLAGKLAAASMYLPRRDFVVARTHEKMDQALADVEHLPAFQERAADVRFLREFARVELLALPDAPAPLAAS